MDMSQWVNRRIAQIGQDRQDKIDAILLDTARDLFLDRTKEHWWITIGKEKYTIRCVICGGTDKAAYGLKHKPDCAIVKLNNLGAIT